MTLKLYGSARSRTSMPRWYLEEKWETFGVINPFAGMQAEVAAQRALENQWIPFGNATLAVSLVCACQPGAGVPAVAGGAKWAAGRGLGTIQPGALPTAP